ncbi:MAG: hypothetical protein EHM21_13285 [Chloroflexi bacterium]|nr:MAG: hypothetical protein EHM21_13285 [Chloroflexota bacterium]
MTERSINSGSAPQIVIRSGGDVLVKGWENDQVLAESSGNWGLEVKRKKGQIEVQIGGNGQVLVPFGSSVKVYAGRSGMVENVQGTVSIVAGWDAHVVQSNVLRQASAGRAMDIDCRRIEGNELNLTAGWHLRCAIREEQNVRYLVDDLGGKWQATTGAGSTLIRLKAGGDVTLVTDQAVVENR